MSCSVVFPGPEARNGLSNGHYGHRPRGPCALGAQERKKIKNVLVFTLSANNALVFQTLFTVTPPTNAWLILKNKKRQL